MTSTRQALLVARLRILDATRDRKAFLTSLGLPLVMVAAFGLLSLIAANADERRDDLVVKVAIARSPGAERVLADLERDGIELIRTAQPESLVVRDKADVALTLPATADADVAAGRRLRAEVIAGANAKAAEAVATTETALHHAALTGSQRPVEVELTTERVDGRPKAAASAVARTVPLLALVVALPFLTSGVRALSGTRKDRSIEHLLPLPIPRPTLLLGLALGTIGAEAVQQLLLLGLLAVLGAVLVLVGAIAWTGPLVLGISLAAAAVAAGSLGVLLGSIARSERIVGLMLTVSSTVLFGVATVLQFADRTPSGPEVTVIPLVGPVLAARAALTPEGLGAAGAFAMVVGNAAAAVVALRLAGRRLASGGGLRL